MLNQFLAIFAPPTFDDESKNAPATILNAVLLISMGSLLLISIFTSITSNSPLVAVLVYTVVGASLIPLYLLMHQGYIRAVSVLLIVVLYAAITVTNVLLGGIDGPLMSGYLALIVTAALLIGPMAGGVVAIVNGLTIIMFYLLGQSGSLPTPELNVTPGTTVFIELFNSVLIAMFVYITTRTLTRYLDRARINEAAARDSLDELMATTVSKNYVDNILQSMSNLLIVLNPDGDIRTVNQATIDLLGYTEDELIGQGYNDIILVDGEGVSGMRATGLMRIANARDVDQVYRAKDGRHIPVTVSTATMLSDEGAIQGVVCVAQDVTERHEAEKQLRYQAGLLEAVFDAIIATDMKLKIISWNTAAQKLYGYSADEVIGRKLTDVLPYGGGDNDLIKAEYFKRGYWQNEVPQVRRDGTPIQVLSSISLMRDDNDKPNGLITINHDITRRKEAEEVIKKRADQLATLRNMDMQISSSLEINAVMRIALEAAVTLSNADAGFIVLREDGQPIIEHSTGRYAYLSKHRTTELYGVLGRAARTLQPQIVTDLDADPDYVSDLPDSVEVIGLPLISHDQLLGVMNLETTQRGQFTQDIFDLLVILTSRISVAVDNARLYAIAQDQLLEMHELYQQVSTLEQLKTDMIRIASHDMRNPIGVINGYIQLLQTDLADRMTQEEGEFLDQIASATRRMNEIATNILSLERIQQIALEGTHTETVDLKQLAQQVFEDHVQGAAEQGIQMHFKSLVEGPALIYGDTSQLYQALTNFVTNAIKYTASDGQITVQVEQVDTMLRVEVCDTGYGIPKEQQARLFQPFFRVESPETEHIDGTGLGLHLVKNIVERHDGEIIFKSVHGEGSTFGFALPVAEGKETNDT